MSVLEALVGLVAPPDCLACGSEGSARQDRLEQLQGKFAVKSPESVGGCKILLIDDVLTTGGTLIAATQALRAAGAARIDALIFAKRL